MTYDSYGYSCSALHLIGLLSDPSFADFVKEVSEVNASAAEETKKGETSSGSKRRRSEDHAGDERNFGEVASDD